MKLIAILTATHPIEANLFVGYLLGFLIAFFILGYLIFSLIYPEKF